MVTGGTCRAVGLDRFQRGLVSVHRSARVSRPQFLLEQGPKASKGCGLGSWHNSCESSWMPHLQGDCRSPGYAQPDAEMGARLALAGRPGTIHRRGRDRKRQDRGGADAGASVDGVWPGRRLYIALPTMATANAMFDRLGHAVRHLFAPDFTPSLALAHGARDLHHGFREARDNWGGPNWPMETAASPMSPHRQPARNGSPTTGGVPSWRMLAPARWTRRCWRFCRPATSRFGYWDWLIAYQSSTRFTLTTPICGARSRRC